MSETTHTAATTRASGPGRLLVAVYALFAVAATGRSTVQILTRFEEAPLAYSLSALAAAVYIAATVALAEKIEEYQLDSKPIMPKFLHERSSE